MKYIFFGKVKAQNTKRNSERELSIQRLLNLRN